MKTNRLMTLDLPFPEITSEKIDKFFADNHVVQFRERVRILNAYMGAADEFDLAFGVDEFSDEDLYAVTKEMVLDGDWKRFKRA